MFCSNHFLIVLSDMSLVDHLVKLTVNGRPHPQCKTCPKERVFSLVFPCQVGLNLMNHYHEGHWCSR